MYQQFLSFSLVMKTSYYTIQTYKPIPHLLPNTSLHKGEPQSSSGCVTWEQTPALPHASWDQAERC